MPPLAAVALISAAALAFEILLVRLLSIAQWHHFAHMIISLALLGYGVSGTALALARQRLVRQPARWFAAGCIAFAVSAPTAFALAQRVPLNVLELAWDLGQWPLLALVYLLLAVPFVFAGGAIGLALATAGDRIGRVYRSDLIGAGIGTVVVVGVLFVLEPGACLRIVALAGLVAAAVATVRLRRRGVALAAIAAVAAALLLMPEEWTRPVPSPHKGLPMALTVPDAEVIASRTSPLGTLTVVQSPTIPFRHAPGLGMFAPSAPAEQLGVFTDAGDMSVITRLDGEPRDLAYLDHQTAALPHHLRRGGRVLVLGAGGGGEVLRALALGAGHVDAVELDPQMVDLLEGPFRGYSGGLYSRPDVTVHVTEARSFAQATDESFDVISIALLDSFTAASAGLHAIGESSLYTVEAFELFLRRLAADGGLLAVTRWLRVPPRDSLKLIATAALALQRLGIEDPGRHMAVIRGWQTVTLVVGPVPLSARDIDVVRRFSADRGFDLVHLPAMLPEEANRHAVLDQPLFFDGAAGLLGPDRDRFLAAYRFDVAPATDDRPYFFHFLKTSTLLDLVGDRTGGGFGLIDWGYPVLLATIVQALLLSLLLVVGPLMAARTGGRPETVGSDRGCWRRGTLVVYFVALGLAFLFVEMSFIQRFQLFLGHPLYAVAVTLAGFLVFAGLGSGAAAWWTRLCGGPARAVVGAVILIATFATATLVLQELFFEHVAGAGRAVRIAVALVLVAPVATCMGLPFPIALTDVSQRAPALVPWAWGINGCASVLAATLAALLALHAGFTVVIGAALGFYGVAAATIVVALRREQVRRDG